MEKQAVIDPAVTPPAEKSVPLVYEKFAEQLRSAGVKIDRLDDDVTKRLADKVETTTKQGC
jgi:hypothetical protein